MLINLNDVESVLAAHKARVDRFDDGNIGYTTTAQKGQLASIVHSLAIFFSDHDTQFNKDEFLSACGYVST